jgi:streptogramin lyase
MPKNQALAIILIGTFLISSCSGTARETLPAPSIDTTSTIGDPTPTQNLSAETTDTAIIFFINNGNISAWEESNRETHTIYDGGDAISVLLSPDGKQIAYLRREIVNHAESDWHEQSSLWVMDVYGGNQRELVSADQLRGLLAASETDSTNMPQVDWVPGSHRLLFTGWIYFVQAEGESHAFPIGLHIVDAETGELNTLMPNENSARFTVSPDGLTIAVMTTFGFGFMNVDGNNPRLDFLDYPDVGFGGSAFPSGVWTQDSNAFMLASSYISETGEQVMAIRRVPVDGSSAAVQATLIDSHPDSVVFSPNGRHLAYAKSNNWYIADLEGDTRQLAIPYGAFFFWRRIHWSPAGIAYATIGPSLHQLCPDATQETESCKTLELGEAVVKNGWSETPADIAYVEWIDDQRFMFTTREPEDLYYGNLNGEISLVSTRSVFFSVQSTKCVNSSEFAAGGGGPSYSSTVAGDVIEVSWILRNSGTCTWEGSYQMNYLGGNLVDPTAALRLGKDVKPGEEIEVKVEVTAPLTTGEFLGEWQLFGADGVPFGVRLPVQGEVPNYSLIPLPADKLVFKNPSIMGLIDYGDGKLWTLSTPITVQIVGIDTETNIASNPIKLGDLLSSIAADFGSVWVVGGDTNLTRIDPASNTVSAIIGVELSEHTTLERVATGAGSVWVSSSSDNNVYRINPETNQVEAKIAVPWAAFVAATENAVWVTNWIEPFLTRIDPMTNEVTAVIELECTISGIDANETSVWAACMNDPTLFRIDPATNRVVARFGVGDGFKRVAVAGDSVWLTTRRGGILIQIDSLNNQVVASYTLGQNTFDLASDGKDIWVSVQGEGAIWRIRP